MMIHFQYSVICDLVYHILAHMKVENASNLYSEDYINLISKSKNETESLLCKEVEKITEYYNDNFERLGIINFLPCYCFALEELQNALLTYNDFTDEDKDRFIVPLCNIIENEIHFYEGYWLNVFSETKADRTYLEGWMKARFLKYEPLFLYFKKQADIGFSYSLSCNGRGYYQKNSFNAIVPFETDQNKYNNTFYQLLHEFTHQFTDRLVATNIKMKDGTHTVSENTAILFNYYLIRTLYPEDLVSYCKWIKATSNRNCFDENSIVHCFPVDNCINESLLKLTSDIKEYLL